MIPTREMLDETFARMVPSPVEVSMDQSWGMSRRVARRVRWLGRRTRFSSQEGVVGREKRVEMDEGEGVGERERERDERVIAEA